MTPNNVVPFRPACRSGMARRGAPDKTHGSPAEAFEIQCPRCAAVLCIEAVPSSTGQEVLCAGCEAAIPVEGGARLLEERSG